MPPMNATVYLSHTVIRLLILKLDWISIVWFSIALRPWQVVTNSLSPFDPVLLQQLQYIIIRVHLTFQVSPSHRSLRPFWPFNHNSDRILVIVLVHSLLLNRRFGLFQQIMQWLFIDNRFLSRILSRGLERVGLRSIVVSHVFIIYFMIGFKQSFLAFDIVYVLHWSLMVKLVPRAIYLIITHDLLPSVDSCSRFWGIRRNSWVLQGKPRLIGIQMPGILSSRVKVLDLLKRPHLKPLNSVLKESLNNSYWLTLQIVVSDLVLALYFWMGLIA